MRVRAPWGLKGIAELQHPRGSWRQIRVDEALTRCAGAREAARIDLPQPERQLRRVEPEGQVDLGRLRRSVGVEIPQLAWLGRNGLGSLQFLFSEPSDAGSARREHRSRTESAMPSWRMKAGFLTDRRSEHGAYAKADERPLRHTGPGSREVW